MTSIHFRPPFTPRRSWLKPAVLAAAFCLVLAACAVPSELPPEVEAALLDYWASLPSSGEITNEIVRAWPGDLAEAGTPPDMEAWCVEAVMHAPDPEIDGQALLWIVTRQSDDAPWRAAMLATLSATWPYEACGQAILS